MSETERIASLDSVKPIAGSPAMARIMRQVKRLASSDVPVLIEGETGTGKEVISRAIHEGGSRSACNLGTVNCGALPEPLVESTLFGYEKGAFTGAEKRTPGVFEASQGGTVLLDEIGEMPLVAQTALLRVLETHRLVRVGGTAEVPVDVRILAATHRDLDAMCEAGSFRRDLYYRLNVLTLTLPPLRERREDIRPLAERLLHQAATRNRITIRGIRPQAMALLLRHDWPGNVRELKNVMERAAVIADGDWINPWDLPETLIDEDRTLDLIVPPSGEFAEQSPGKPAKKSPESLPRQRPGVDDSPPRPILDFKSQMQQHEIEVIIEALERTERNQTQAARLLKMPLRTLVHKIKLHDIRRILSDRDNGG